MKGTIMPHPNDAAQDGRYPLVALEAITFLKSAAAHETVSDYHESKLLGSGAQASVRLASYGEKSVAVKIFDQGSSRTRKKGRTHAQNEISMLTNYRHPHIIEGFGLVCDDQVPMIILEYADGGNLERYFRTCREEKRKLNYRTQMIPWAYGVASAMAFLHQADIIHRDIKSSNVLLFSGRVKLTDFSFAAKVGEVEKCMQGSAFASAPEVLKEGEYSYASDCYSFGVFLWEMTTLEEAWANMNLVDIHFAMELGQSLPIPKEAKPVFKEVMQGCFFADPSKRLGAADIEAKIQGESKLNEPQSLSRRHICIVL